MEGGGFKTLQLRLIGYRLGPKNFSKDNFSYLTNLVEINSVTRRKRVDSVEERTRIVVGINRELAPPSHVPLEDNDFPYWHSVIAEFARAEWSEHQLELAAMLARTLANLEENQRQLRDEGFIIYREGGQGRKYEIENPRSRIVKSLTSDILSLRRSLALHARGRESDVKHTAQRHEIAREIERQAGGADDDLIA